MYLSWFQIIKENRQIVSISFYHSMRTKLQQRNPEATFTNCWILGRNNISSFQQNLFEICHEFRRNFQWMNHFFLLLFCLLYLITYLMNIQKRLKLRSFHFSSSFVFFHYIYSLFYTFCCKNQKSHNMLRLTFSFLLNVLCSMCKW